MSNAEIVHFGRHLHPRDHWWYRVLRLWPWARYLVLILAVLHLFNVPIGAVAGVYTIWVLIQDETAQIFARGKEDQVSLTTVEP